MRGASKLRIALTAVLWVIAILSVLLAFVPSFRVGIRNAWMRATGRDTVPTVIYTTAETDPALPFPSADDPNVTFSPEAADPIYAFELPEGYRLVRYEETPPVYAYGAYTCPERGEQAMIQISVMLGGGEASFDTENVLAYEELALGGRQVIYTEKIYPGTDGALTRSVFIISVDPQYYAAVSTCGMTREEVLALAETMTIRIPERFAAND